MNQTITNKSHQFNIPPVSYCTSYTSLSKFYVPSEPYPISDLFGAAKTPIASCNFTGFNFL